MENLTKIIEAMRNKHQGTTTKEEYFGVGRHGGAITTRSPKYSFGLSSREPRGRSLRQRAARRTKALHERSEFIKVGGVYSVEQADGREPLGEPRRRSVDKKNKIILNYAAK